MVKWTTTEQPHVQPNIAAIALDRRNLTENADGKTDNESRYSSEAPCSDG
jgi:hypothetical protein